MASQDTYKDIWGNVKTRATTLEETAANSGLVFSKSTQAKLERMSRLMKAGSGEQKLVIQALRRRSASVEYVKWFKDSTKKAADSAKKSSDLANKQPSKTYDSAKGDKAIAAAKSMGDKQEAIAKSLQDPDVLGAFERSTLTEEKMRRGAAITLKEAEQYNEDQETLREAYGKAATASAEALEETAEAAEKTAGCSGKVLIYIPDGCLRVFEDELDFENCERQKNGWAECPVTNNCYVVVRWYEDPSEGEEHKPGDAKKAEFVNGEPDPSDKKIVCAFKVFDYKTETSKLEQVAAGGVVVTWGHGSGGGGGGGVVANGTWTPMGGGFANRVCLVGSKVLEFPDQAPRPGILAAEVKLLTGECSGSDGGVSYMCCSGIYDSFPQSTQDAFYIPIYRLRNGTEAEGGGVVVETDYRSIPTFAFMDVFGLQTTGYTG